jgi:chemotaxis signal transduction protein
MENTTLSLNERYLITLVGQEKLAFPAHWLKEILIIERKKILVLPFYNSLLLGVINHHNQIIPLISVAAILGQQVKSDLFPQNLITLRFNESVEKLGGVGVVVDELKGNLTEAELDQERILQFSNLPSDIWEPLY